MEGRTASGGVGGARNQGQEVQGLDLAVKHEVMIITPLC